MSCIFDKVSVNNNSIVPQLKIFSRNISKLPSSPIIEDPRAYKVIPKKNNMEKEELLQILHNGFLLTISAALKMK